MKNILTTTKKTQIENITARATELAAGGMGRAAAVWAAVCEMTPRCTDRTSLAVEVSDILITVLAEKFLADHPEFSAAILAAEKAIAITPTQA